MADLRSEYAYPNKFGSMNQIIEEMDHDAGGDDEVFDDLLREYIR